MPLGIVKLQHALLLIILSNNPFISDLSPCTMQYSPNSQPIRTPQQEIIQLVLYPTRYEIEAVLIPDSQEVFGQISPPSIGPRKGQDQLSDGSSCRLISPDACMETVYMSGCHSSHSDSSLLSKPKSIHRDTKTDSVDFKLEFVSVPGPAYTPLVGKPPAQRDTVEVFPGVFLPVHGRSETLISMQQGQLQRCTCLVCAQTIMCVPQASYILCPDCRVVSPVDTSSDIKKVLYGPHEGGVGLGMSCPEFDRWEQANGHTANKSQGYSTE
jgi:hypothetical protein